MRTEEPSSPAQQQRHVELREQVGVARATNALASSSEPSMACVGNSQRSATITMDGHARPELAPEMTVEMLPAATATLQSHRWTPPVLMNTHLLCALVVKGK
jgi:hypothetical protein